MIKYNEYLSFEERYIMSIIKMNVGDTLELKKLHPCGGNLFTVLRVGSEIRMKCTTCGRDLTLDRIKLERAVRRVIPTPEDPVS